MSVSAGGGVASDPEWRASVRMHLCRYFARGTLTFSRKSGKCAETPRKVAIFCSVYVGILMACAKKHLRRLISGLLHQVVCFSTPCC